MENAFNFMRSYRSVVSFPKVDNAIIRYLRNNRNMKKYIFLPILIFLAFACKNKELKQPLSNKAFTKLDQLHWLLGNWQNISPEKQSYERWKQQDDSTLVAHSFTLIESDTVFAERLTLKQIASDVFLTAIAYQQNDDQPVSFKMIPSEPGVFTFENPDHDFPTRISYSNPVKDSIHAWIDGMVEGEDRKVDFFFERQY
jgi:hypothetical protein